MKPILFLIACCLSIQTHAQFKLGAQAGAGCSFITAKNASLSGQLTATGGVSFTTGNFRDFDYGVNVYFERYAPGFTNTRSSHNSSWGKDVKESANYLLIAPQLEFRLAKFVHLNLMPSAGFLLSGNEHVNEHYYNYNIQSQSYTSTDSSYATSNLLHKVIFRLAAEFQEFIPVSKGWWITVSERATYCLPKYGITDSKVVRNYTDQKANPLYCSLQLGVAHRFNHKQAAKK